MADLAARFRAAVRRARAALALPRSTHCDRGTKDPQGALRGRIRELAGQKVRYGYRRRHLLLRREGWAVNKTRVYRRYTLDRPTVRRKKPRRTVTAKPREDRPAVDRATQVWAMDFVSARLADGRKARVLTVLDVFTRESLAIRADARFTADMVVEVLGDLKGRRGVPGRLRADNGPEFAGRMLDLWAYWNGVTLDFSRPGKPTDNAFIASFHGRLRDECPNPHWFLCLDEVKDRTERWRVEYNRERPHSALGNLAPEAFASQQAGAKQSSCG